jgi:hypothetical protein
MMKKTAALLSTILTTGLFVLIVSNEALAGPIKILTQSPTSKVKNIKAFANRNSTKFVYEAGTARTWEFELVAFFSRKLGDNEVTLMFYDAQTDKYVDSQIKMTRDFNSKILLCRVRLSRPPFDANKTYKVVAQDKDGRKLATGQFTTRGTSQQQIDAQKRYEHAQKEMEKSMKDLERRAKEQEEAEKRRKSQENKKAADNLF